MKRSLLASCIIISGLMLSACGSRLVVTSTPVAARVQVNDQDYGTTPLKLDNLRTGVYAVAVKADGFEPWRSEIELNQSQSIHAILQRATPPPPAPLPRLDPPPPAPRSVTRVSVFVEPAGSKVTVDGRYRGLSVQGEPIVVAYEQPPTMVEVAAEKDGYERWVKGVAPETLRDNRVFIRLVPASDWYNYTTDAEFLRKTVSQVVASSANAPSLRRSSRLAVLSIAHAEGTDDPLQAMIEDAFITALAQAGFTPAERDDQMLVQLAHSTSGPALPYTVLTEHRSVEDPFVYDAALATTRTETIREHHPVVLSSTSTTTRNEGCADRVVEQSSTRREESSVTESSRTVRAISGQVPTAEQFLAYRILECGLSKTPIAEGEPRPEPMLHRYASVRVHVRVIDAKDGRITWAGFLTGQMADEIPSRVSAHLANPPNRFISEPLPDSWQRLRHGTGRQINPVEGASAPVPRLR